MNYNGYLREKKKDELITIARKFSISGFSKLSKGELIKKILSFQNEKNFKSIIGISKPWYRRKSIIPISLSLGLFYFLYSQFSGTKNTEQIIYNQNSHFEELIEIVSPNTLTKGFISEEEYGKRIEKFEKLNRILLHDFYGDDFAVYGQKDNHLFKNSKIYESSIKVIGNSLSVKLNIQELPFLWDSENMYVNNLTVVTPIPGGTLTIGQRFNLRLWKVDNQAFWITVLDDNPEAPVFALGLNKI